MASKKLRVRLLTRIAHIGKEGDIVEVNHSFAMNSLLPKKQAVVVTPDEENRLAEEAKKREHNARFVIEEFQKIHDTLHLQSLAFDLRGNGDTVFGSIAETDILEKIETQFGFTLEKKHIVLPEGKHLKRAGNHDVKIHLGHDLYTRMTIIVSVRTEK